MFNITTQEIKWGDKTLTLETGKIARQALGSVIAKVGDCMILAAVTAAKEAKADQDFFPLTVHYQEKTYAAGKIPGGFFKREARPSEFETLTSRLIDRPLRPSFVDGFKNETQVVCTLLSSDPEVQPDVIALVAASAALTISGLPFLGPVAAARVGYKDGEYTLNPTKDDIAESSLDLMLAANKSSVLMVESEADQLSEEVMLGAVKFGHEQMQPVIDGVVKFAEKCAKEPWALPAKPDNSAIEKKLATLVEKDLREAYKTIDKQERVVKLGEAKQKALAELCDAENAEAPAEKLVSDLFKSLEKSIVRGDLMKTKKRIDGRKTDQIRNIIGEVGLLPRTHGSALFTRGETQGLVTVTLGTGQDEQIIDALTGEYKESFMLHYNFPPYSVGEAGRMGPPGRREIGHGKLAWRALKALMPSKEEFPYTIRLVSEITESNGSSSMATVCGGSLALMDAGVPLKAPIAGIAMGLVKDEKDFVVLSDILGDEDHLGDMDFKVAGTEEGITSLQMDIKINGVTTEIMTVALDQAKGGRLHILGEMAKALKTSRTDLNAHAPRITSVSIPKDKIGELIGPGGKNIRNICETSGATVDIDEDGTVKVASSDQAASDKALAMIDEMFAEPVLNTVYDAEVVTIVDFGAFVRYMGPLEGLVHISEINDERVENVKDILSEGDKVKVKLYDFDRGKAKLSMRLADQETGEDLDPNGENAPKKVERSERSGGGRSRDDRGGRGRDDRGGRGRDDRGGRGRDDRGGRGDRDRGERSESRGDRDDRGDRGPRRSRDDSDDRGPRKRRA